MVTARTELHLEDKHFADDRQFLAALAAGGHDTADLNAAKAGGTGGSGSGGSGSGGSGGEKLLKPSQRMAMIDDTDTVTRAINDGACGRVQPQPASQPAGQPASQPASRPASQASQPASQARPASQPTTASQPA
eukprot:SAG22_NODE_8177_length_677_cov_0.846021_1_plen_133_part_01